jgi:cytochrome oxidase Cu insertion factor (SCO1/SenC/PrrC family)
LVLVVASASLGFSQTKAYPKPQIASAEGHLAPDFTLKDQAGQEFRLSDHRGLWVLLFFYRGYW